MAEVPTIISEKIRKFAEFLEKDNVQIEQLYLFGSYANGKFNEWSDIDLAIVSKDFTGIRHLDFSKFVEAIIYVDKAIEPIAYHPSNFNENDILANEIIKNGIRYI